MRFKVLGTGLSVPTSALVTAVRLHPFWCSSPLQRGDARLAAVAHVSHGATGQALRWHLVGDGMDERQDPAARQGRRKWGAARQGEELATAAGTHGATGPTLALTEDAQASPAHARKVLLPRGLSSGLSPSTTEGRGRWCVGGSRAGSPFAHWALREAPALGGWLLSACLRHRGATAGGG